MKGVDLEERLCSDQKKDLSISSFHEKKGEVVFSFIKSHPDDEAEIPHQNWNQRLMVFLYDDPISEVKFHSFYNPDNDHGHDQESGLLPG